MPALNRFKLWRWRIFLLGLSLFALIFTAQAQTNDPRPLYQLSGLNTRVFHSGTMALAGDGRTLVTANMLNDTASIVDVVTRQIIAEVPVGNDPRAVALTRDDTRALIVNRVDGTLSVLDIASRSVVATMPVGDLPYAVITDNNDTAFIALQATNEIIRIDLNTRRINARVPTPPSPEGLALWGDFLYVTHMWSGDLSLIYVPEMRLVQTVSTGVDTSMSHTVIIDPRTGLAYLPQSRSLAQNPALTFDSTILPVVNVVDLSVMTLQRKLQIRLDVADRPVNMPFAAVIDPPGRNLYVVNAGSDDLSIIDMESGLARAHINVGANPRDVLLNRDNSLAIVHSVIDGTITLVNTVFRRVDDVLTISDLTIPIDEFIGAQLFHSADDPRLSQDSWISCASCHFDGQSDGRVWNGRNTPSLYDLSETAPYGWMGDWDELADLELHLRALQVGDGLIEGVVNPATGDPNTGLSLDLDTLVAYLLSIDSPPPPQATDALLNEHGATIFENLGCNACHSGAEFTDGQGYDVETGGMFTTPSLNWLWQSAPYFHAGSAVTLRDVFILPGAHQVVDDLNVDEFDALIAYLLSLPQ
jgi:YVTN family beta-propeller protein